MKRFLSLLILLVFSITITVSVLAQGSFDSAEYSRAISLSGTSWSEFSFNSDLLIKVNVTAKNTVSIFEMDSNYGKGQALHCFVYTKSKNSYRTQSITTGIPSYTAVPHLSDMESGYIKINYDAPENAWLRGKTLKIRLSEISSNSKGWENAEKMGLNEEHIIKFSSMSDSKWFKLVVPDDSFRYTYNINTFNQGCFMGAIYRESSLKSGSGDASFCDCIRLYSSKITIDTHMGAGTYYIQLYPVPFYNDVLDTKFFFATDNKNSNEIVNTSFGAEVSTWAKDEVEKAYKNNLIPKKLERGDLTKKVTREEFAAIAVQLYSKLSGKNVGRAADCHFDDISDSEFMTEIKQAYEISAVQGISDTKFAPRDYINREQLATILCRVLKRDMEDKNITFRYADNYRIFEDDAFISDWAKPSVYFMASEGLVKGVTDTKFAPKNTTSEQEALGYASATKEQAIIIAQRIFNSR